MPEYVASISYGKDSLAMLEVIHKHGLPLDRIITAQVMFDETTPGDYPEMYAFKEHADRFIKNRYGLTVEHFTAGQTYKEIFLRKCSENAKNGGFIYAWPFLRGPWCNSLLKMRAIRKAQRSARGCVSYIGIAADEPERIERHGKKPGVQMPLVDYGITEADALEICRGLDILAPTYETGARDGCFFCHNQRIDGLRRLRRDYPELWAELLALDAAELEAEKNGAQRRRFKANGRSLHDYDERLRAEDLGLVLPSDSWEWAYTIPEEAERQRRRKVMREYFKPKCRKRCGFLPTREEAARDQNGGQMPQKGQ